MKNYDHTTREKPYCVLHRKHCRPITGSWVLRENGWECSDVNIPFPEFTSQRIKDERREYASDMLQSHRGGSLSREWVETYPDRARKMMKEGIITKEEIKKSKHVWQEVKGWEKGRKVDAESLIR